MSEATMSKNIHIYMYGGHAGGDKTATRDADEISQSRVDRLIESAKGWAKIGWTENRVKQEISQHRMTPAQRNAVLSAFNQSKGGAARDAKTKDISIQTQYRGFTLREDVNGIFTILKNGKDATGMTWRKESEAKKEVDELIDKVGVKDAGKKWRFSVYSKKDRKLVDVEVVPDTKRNSMHNELLKKWPPSAYTIEETGEGHDPNEGYNF